MTAASSLFEAVGPDGRRAIRKMAVRRRYGPDEVVFHEGDPGDSLHIVEKGVFVARSSSTQGHLIAVNVFRPGSVFGELVLLTDNPYRSAGIVSLGRGETLMIRRQGFEELRRRIPQVDRFLVTVLAERNRALNEHLIELLFTPVDQRVYRRVIGFGQVTEDREGWIHLDQSDLATLAGTTRATANRALRKAAEAGLVELARGRVRVLDAEGLAQRAR